ESLSLHATARHARSPLPLHDALPIYEHSVGHLGGSVGELLDEEDRTALVGGVAHDGEEPLEGNGREALADLVDDQGTGAAAEGADRKSTRLNSSHQIISYAVFCLKKK